MIFQWGQDIKYGGKLFMADLGQIVLVKFTAVLFYMEA